jgi:hypothetical protein
MGWGEDIVRAGKILEDECRNAGGALNGTRCAEVTLYIAHSGLWLPGASTISVDYLSRVIADPPLDKKSYYAVNRLYLIQNYYPVPKIDPDYVVAHRGYVLSWIYRGDRLRESGYRFK